MAKKDVQDDVLGNKFSLVNAKSSKLLSSWMGAEPTPMPSSNDVSDTKDEDADLKQTEYGHDRLGVGSVIPKDIADGSFTRRAPTTNDKLLEQLLGKKRAKAHIAAKQEAERASARQQPTWQQKKEEKKTQESDDEEESRTELLKSKRGRPNERQASSKSKAKDVEVEKPRSTVGQTGADEGLKEDAATANQDQQEETKQESDDDIDLKPKKRVKKSRAKPTSYLDEILAERNKKKGKGK
ncbi:hypothetical protein EJ07DRAFT_55022, partial [Lizonia empirigonia]